MRFVFAAMADITVQASRSPSENPSGIHTESAPVSSARHARFRTAGQSPDLGSTTPILIVTSLHPHRTVVCSISPRDVDHGEDFVVEREAGIRPDAIVVRFIPSRIVICPLSSNVSHGTRDR
jgi:hypothetical protein